MAKNRSLRAVNRRLGRIDSEVRRVIDSVGTADVLEVGCGFGLPMLELKKRFRERVRIVGINKSEEFNLPKKAILEGIKQFRLPPWDLWRIEQTIGFPEYVNCDASLKLPFESESFDIVYSIVATGFFKDKIHFLEDVNRILKPDGLARIHFHHCADETGRDPNAPGPPYNNLCEIRDMSESVVSTCDYLSMFPTIKFVKREGGLPEYLEQRKFRGDLDLGLELKETCVLSEIDPSWVGYTRSVYHIRGSRRRTF